MIKGMKALSILLLFFCFDSAQATELSLVGGLNYAAPTQKISGVGQNWTGNAAPTYGFFINTSIFGTAFDAETGLLFLTSTYGQPDSQGNMSDKTMHSTQIPFLLRFNIDEAISLGVGGYLAYTGEGRDPALSVGDQGLVADIRAKFHVLPQIHLLLDARYQHGLANQAIISTDSYNTRSVQFLAGIGIDFGSSRSKEKTMPIIQSE